MDNYIITITTFNKIAVAYQERFMDMNIYDDGYDIFCSLLSKPGASIFEIACGPGNITKYLLSKRPDFKIDATDVAPNMIELAIQNNPTANFQIMDCRDIVKISKKYDAVVCGFCMPYLSREDVGRLVKDCAALLMSGGIFYFSAIEGDYSKSGFVFSSDGKDKTYTYWHSEDSLNEMLLQNNFERLHLKRQEFQKLDGTVVVDMIFIAVKR